MLRKSYKVTRKQLKQIYDIACEQLKLEIENIAKMCLPPFEEAGNLSSDIVSKLFAVATEKQIPVLEQIFGKVDKNAFVKIFPYHVLQNMSQELFGVPDVIEIAHSAIDDENLKGRSIFVKKDYEVILHKFKGMGQQDYYTVIEIRKK